LEVKDLPDKDMVTAKQLLLHRTIADADQKGEDVEISDFHENYLQEEKIQPLKTVMTENPYKIYTIRNPGHRDR